MTPVNAGMHTRENLSVLARSEKRALIWIARRLPNFINSDHLSALGLVAMASAGLSFAAFRLSPWAAVGVVVIARCELVRRQPRRHGRAGQESAAPAIWVLRRSHHRYRRHDVSARGDGVLRVDEPARCPHHPCPVPGRVGGVVSCDARCRDLSYVVSRFWTDGASNPHCRRRDQGRDVAVGGTRALLLTSSSSMSAPASHRSVCSRRLSSRPFETQGRCISRNRFRREALNRGRHESPNCRIHQRGPRRIPGADDGSCRPEPGRHTGPLCVAMPVAVEAAVLTNFFWHERWTWHDRVQASGRWSRLLRFHITNGIDVARRQHGRDRVACGCRSD